MKKLHGGIVTAKELRRMVNKGIFKTNSDICRSNGLKINVYNFEKLGLKIPENLKGGRQ